MLPYFNWLWIFARLCNCNGTIQSHVKRFVIPEHQLLLWVFLGEDWATIGINRTSGIVDVHHEFAIGCDDGNPFQLVNVSRTAKVRALSIVCETNSCSNVVTPGIPLKAALNAIQRGV
jgi:hypothetical protein